MQVFLTGDTGTLGTQLTQQLLQSGNSVIGIGRRTPERFKELSKNPSYEHLTIDLENLEAIESQLGPLFAKSASHNEQSVLILNAAMIDPLGNLASLSDFSSLERSLKINISANLLLSHLYLKNKSVSGSRCILFISSGASSMPIVGMSPYCLGKAALDMAMRCLAIENTDRFKSLIIIPGIFESQMQKTLRDANTDRFKSQPVFEKMKTSGALKDAAAVAGKIIFVMASLDRFASGSTVNIDTL